MEWLKYIMTANQDRLSKEGDLIIEGSLWVGVCNLSIMNTGGLHIQNLLVGLSLFILVFLIL